VSLKLSKAKRGEKRQPRFDTEKLKNTNIGKAFHMDLQNSFCILQEEHELTIGSFNQVNKQERFRLPKKTNRAIDERKITKEAKRC